MIDQLTFGEEKNESIKELHFRCQELQSEIAVFLEEQGNNCPQNIRDQVW